MRVRQQLRPSIRPHSVDKTQNERCGREEAYRDSDIPLPAPQAPRANAEVCLGDDRDEREDKVGRVYVRLLSAVLSRRELTVSRVNKSPSPGDDVITRKSTIMMIRVALLLVELI